MTRKNMNLAVYFKSDCFSCISPEPLELQKSYLRLFASLSEEISDEKRIFEIQLQNHFIIIVTTADRNLIYKSNKCAIERLHIDKKRYLICSLL